MVQIAASVLSLPKHYNMTCTPKQLDFRFVATITPLVSQQVYRLSSCELAHHLNLTYCNTAYRETAKKVGWLLYFGEHGIFCWSTIELKINAPDLQTSDTHPSMNYKPQAPHPALPRHKSNNKRLVYWPLLW